MSTTSTTATSTTPDEGGHVAFRPDIEGLRAAAVVAVIVYHAGAISGGFVGVDVFFALSGFLITQLLVSEHHRSGTVNLIGFYARRVRRLLPASAFVLLVVLAVSAVALPGPITAGIASDVRAAALYVSNIAFAQAGTDYLASGLPPSPVQNFWSLSVEEQFYFVFPVLVAFAAARSRRTLIWVIAAVTVASLAVSWWLTAKSQPWAFFTLPARAWEFGAGALLALGWHHVTRVPARCRRLGGWAGLAALTWCAITFDETTPFPGLWAAVPVAATLMLLAAGSTDGTTTKLLSSRPAVTVGKYSYSLYLWHWPALILTAEIAGRELTGAETWAVLAASVVPAVASYHLIENPARRQRWLSALPANSLAAGALLTVTVTAAATIAIAFTQPGADSLESEPISSPPTAEQIVAGLEVDSTEAIVPRPEAPWTSEANALNQHECFAPVDVSEPASDCEFGDPDGDIHVMAIGDSHMNQWWQALVGAAEHEGWRLTLHSKPGCAPVSIELWSDGGSPLHRLCTPWFESVLDIVDAEQPDVLFLSGKHQQAEEYRRSAEQWSLGWERSLERVGHPAGEVVVLNMSPFPGEDVPRCLLRNPEAATKCTLDRDEAAFTEFADVTRRAAERAGAHWYDPADWLCTDTQCPAIIDSTLVYMDHSHVTAALSTAMAGRFVDIVDEVHPR